MVDALLPFVDAYSTDVRAPARVVWNALLDTMPGPRTPLPLRIWAALWKSDPGESNGLACHVIGAERVGFSVCEVVPLATYALAGQHRFARYQLVFRLHQLDAADCRLTAETFAAFPGMPGHVYQALLIDTRSHALVVRLLLRRVRRRAEAAWRRTNI